MNNIHSLKESVAKAIDKCKLNQPVNVSLSNSSLENYLFNQTDMLHLCQQEIVTSTIDIISSILTKKILDHDYKASNDQTLIVKICLSTEFIDEFKIHQIMYKVPFVFNHFTEDVHSINDLCLGAIYLIRKLDPTSISFSDSDYVGTTQSINQTINLFLTNNSFLKALLKNVSVHRCDYKIVYLSHNLFLKKQPFLGFISKYGLFLRHISLQDILKFLNKIDTNFDVENNIIQKINEVKKAYIEDDILNVEINNWKENFNNGNSNKP